VEPPKDTSNTVQHYLPLT